MTARRSESRGAGAWIKFRLLMWKNFLQQWRHPLQTAAELLLPAITMSLVLLLRWQIEPETRPGIIFPPFNAHSLNSSVEILFDMNFTKLSIAYSPESEVLDDVVRTAVADLLVLNAIDLIKVILDNENVPGIPLPPDIQLPDLGSVNTTLIHEFIKTLIRVQSFNTSTELRNIYTDEENIRDTIAAVEFEDHLYGATKLPINITYALRFPERPRFNTFFGSGSRSWRTDLTFPVFELPGPRSSNPNGGRDPGYVTEMFIALQHMISTTLISKLTGESMRSFNVNLQRYPHPVYVQDLAVDALQILFPTFILLSFSYTAVNITRAVTVEKELQIKETLKIMGLPTWIHWTAWFCKQFLFLLLSSVLIVVILKVAQQSLFAGVIWFLTYVPAFMLAMDIDMSVPVQVLTCLSINSAMSYGFQLILAKESTGGLHWGEFMSTPSVGSTRLLFGHVVIMLVVDCVLYMLIALYLEQVLPGPFGTPKRWYFLIQREFWTSGKVSPGNLAVTRGSVWVAGYDMMWNTHEARRHIGLCPQHNVLFNELTVKEHLEFFARLKGFRGKELNDEINSLIEKLELQEKRDYQAQGLSGGQKRRLCVGIALCGDARVVLLDEPTSGMDPSSRRALWDLLQKEKLGRSMILTTHFMDEADILGDRIAIMSNGQLQCVGSPFFLKKHYGVGYTLVIVKNAGFDIDACTNLLNKYIPDINIKEDRGTEASFNLKNNYSHVFEEMLNDLEQQIETIKFSNYGLLATTLEDVFMSVGSDTRPVELDTDNVITESGSDETMKNELDSSSIDRLNEDDAHTGIRLLGQHMVAIWLKLFFVWTRSWGMLLLQVLMPIVQINATLGVMQYIMSLSPSIQRRLLKLTDGYVKTESILAYNGTSLSSIGALAAAAYERVVNGSNDANKVTTVQEPIDEYYLRMAEDLNEMASMRHRVLTGATFSDASVTAWFSNFGYHDIATSLAAVHSALLKSRSPDADITVLNHPLEVNYKDQSNMQMMVQMLSMQLASGIGSSLGMASAVFVMFYIKERVSRAKLLQKAAGIQPAVMWGSAAIFDWFWFLIISISVIVSCAAFNVMGLSTPAELGRLYVCLMVYGAAMLPFNYLLTLLFQGPAMGFVVIFFINVLIGMMGTQIVDALLTPGLSTEDVAQIIDSVLQFFPLFSLCSAVRTLNQHGMTISSCLNWCSMINVQNCTMEAMCEISNVCCVSDDPFFEWEAPNGRSGVLRYLTVSLITGAILWILFMLIEYNIIGKIFRFEKRPPPVDEATVDSDVLDEARHVARVGSRVAEHGLVARELSKYYGKHLAVNQVSFTVSDGECFGLLGVNGAGKTTTFKMLMGDETVSSGDAYVSGHSVKKEITQIHKNIGYCPQFDAVFGELTGRESLKLFGQLRGLRSKHAAARTAALAHALGFTKHLDKRVHQYSGGNKRKLSTAVALLGRTRLVFVDEPTTGVDPAAKRQVWRAIRSAQKSGRGIVLTSHSMEECEALCSRLTVMVNGRFQCLGTPQHLKNKFSEGFTLTIKMRLEDDQHTAASTDAIKEYVGANFVTPKLMEEYQGLLTYYLPDKSIAWSRMFGIMEHAKREINVEDYSISQTSLEQIFLQFTKYQQETIVK
ncbi:hypothetical protein ACJJTC_004027 [Scirpophaga incertulas]